MKKVLAALAVILLPALGFAATNSFEFRRPSNNASQGSINDSTGLLDITAGYRQNGSSTLSNSISGNAGTATALAADPADCTLPQVALGINASGVAQCSQPSNVTGNAATATALAANGTNCSAGNYPLGVDAQGNVESCTPVTGGGHTISTYTGTGSLTDFTQRTKLGFDSNYFTVVDSATADATLVSLSSSVSVPVSTYTLLQSQINIAAGGSLGACVAGSTVSINSTGRPLDIIFSAPVENGSGGGQSEFSILIDGNYPDGFTSSKPMQLYRAVGGVEALNVPMHFNYRTKSSPSAGTHSVCIAARGVTGTNILRCDRAPCRVEVTEPGGVTAGAAISVPASTMTFLGGTPSVPASATLGQCVSGSTITLTTAGGDLAVSLSGVSGDAAASYWSLGVLLDGAFVEGESTTKGLSLVQNGSSYSDNLNFYHRVRNVSAGAHSLCLTGRSNNGVAVSLQCTIGVCQFSAQEIRNVAGTGDVASNGNNTFTGTNTFDKTRVTCPSGFFEVHSQGRALGCMQTSEEGSDTFANANEDCFDTYGGKLPSPAEWGAACSNFAATMVDEGDDNEWLDSVDGGQFGSIVQGATSCYASGTSSQGNSVAYRCWIPK